jgi:amino acid adenylation domain-containing protein
MTTSQKPGIIDDEIIVASGSYEKEERFWMETLAGESEPTKFPPDRRQSPAQGRSIPLETHRFTLPPVQTARILRMSNRSAPRHHMIQVALIHALHDKYHYNGAEETRIGVPVYKQEKEGKYLNTMLILKNRHHRQMTFKDLLVQVRQTVVEATAHQNFPMIIIQERLKIRQETFVLLENIHDKKNITHTTANKTNPNNTPAIIFTFRQDGETVTACWEYDPTAYTQDYIKRLENAYNTLTQQALTQPEILLRNLQVHTHQEKATLLQELTGPHADYPAQKTIHHLFKEQVEKTPNRTALSITSTQNSPDQLAKPHQSNSTPGEGTRFIASTQRPTLTYNELNHRTNQLARYLRRRGMVPGKISALLMEPGLEMITAIMATIKAGGAYLPIDTQQPLHRVARIIKDSQPALMLTQEKCLKTHPYTALQGLNAPRMHRRPRVTPLPQPLTELDRLPLTDRSTVSYEKYNRYIGQAMVKHAVAMQGTRGCPYNCLYCHKIWPKKQAVRSADNLFSEVKHYYDMGVRRFVLIDDIFNLDIKNSTEFYKKIIESGMKLQLFFPNGLRGDIMTPEYIDLMVEAGTVNVALALETASPRLQKLLKKNLNLDKLQHTLDHFQQHHPGVILELFTMHGFPTETEDEARMTMDYIKRQKWLHFPYVHILKIYPNTEMAELAREHGISDEAIAASAHQAYHELPETLPFDKNFTLNYQAEYLNDYFLNNRRLAHVLPYQKKVLTHSELVEKYDSYLPVKLETYRDILEFTGVKDDRVEPSDFRDEAEIAVPDLDRKIREKQPQHKPAPDALKILLMDLSQNYNRPGDDDMLYDVVEPPLGLMTLLTYLNHRIGEKINGKIAKARIDFNSEEELIRLVEDFKPDIIGMRTLTYYKDNLHRAAAQLRQHGIDVPIIAGGPYATSDYQTLLQDQNIQLVVRGEGETVTCMLMETFIESGNRMPVPAELSQIPGLAYIEENILNRHAETNKTNKTNETTGTTTEIIMVDHPRFTAEQQDDDEPEPTAAPGDPAYIIYTSGTTGIPKGVVIEHRNVVRLMKPDPGYFDFNENDVWTMFHKYNFDFSVWEMYGALLNGGRLHIIPGEIARDTEAFRKQLQQEAVTVLNQTPSAFYNLQELETEINGNGNDVNDGNNGNGDQNHRLQLRYVIFGGEALEPARLKKWRSKYPETKLINMYGITETTVHVTYKEITEKEIEAGHGNIGTPIHTLNAAILDHRRNPVPRGVPGELYVGGDGVARGYLNRPELTAEKFIETNTVSSMNREDSVASAARQYKSGDLVRQMENGDMEYRGRVDQQVQIRGFRVELGEIRQHLHRHPKVKDTVVQARGDYLVAYIVTELPISSESKESGEWDRYESEIKEYLSHRLPDYMVPAVYVRLDNIPLTPNGKVDTKALPEPGSDNANTFVPPRGPLETQLVEIMAGVLEREPGTIGRNDNFFELGGHSLKATILSARIHKQLKVKIPLVELFENPTVAGQADVIRKTTGHDYTSIPPAEKKEYYPLAPAQKRVYIMQQQDPQHTGYNIPAAVTLEGNMDRFRLEKAVKALVQRHESLRTSFRMKNGIPVQCIHEYRDIDFRIDEYRSAGSKETEETIIGQISRPFNLEMAPLMRVILIDAGENRWHLLMNIHHIVTDGVSMAVLIKEFIDGYSRLGHPGNITENTDREILQYKDYAQWLQEPRQLESAAKQKQYWIDQFTPLPPDTPLPTDNARPAETDHHGDTVVFELDEEKIGQINRWIREENITLFIYLQALFTILFAKQAGVEDIVIGTAATGRKHADQEQMVGMFINTLALRNKPQADKTFRQYQAEVGDNTIKAFDNQDFPFEELVETLNIKRRRNRNPLFDVMLELQNNRQTQLKIPELTIKPYPMGSGQAKFDLSVTAIETGERITLAISYSTQLYNRSTIETMVRHFNKILEQVRENPDIKLSQIETADREKQQSLQDQFNDDLEDE